MTPEETALIESYPNVIDQAWGEKSPENRLVIESIVEVMPPGASILDIGCNSGWLMEELRDRKGCLVTGIEPANRPFQEALQKGLHVVQAFGHQIPHPDDSFDVAVASSVLQQAEDAEPIVREMRRVTKPGGLLIGVNPTPDGEWGYKGLGQNPYVKRVLDPKWFRYYFPAQNGCFDTKRISEQNYLWVARSVKPKLSSIGVVMPVINCLRYTKQAIQSFLTFYPYEFIVIDNGSTDGTQEWFQTVDRPVHYLRQEKNLGVARSWNLGISTAFKRGHDAAFVINNDLVFAEDTVHNLLRWTEEYEFVTINCIGDDPKRLPWHHRHHDVIPAPHFSGFLITPKIIKRVGWFDEGYELAYFEDCDFHERMSREGIKAVCCLDAIVAHYGSRSIREGGVRHEPQFTKNRNYFKSKWGWTPG